MQNRVGALVFMLLIVGCDDSIERSSGGAEGASESQTGAYAVHEWGFIGTRADADRGAVPGLWAGAGRFPTAASTRPRPAPPPPPPAESVFGTGQGYGRGGKPVLYFHLDPGVDALDVEVGLRLPGGEVVEHWPPVTPAPRGEALSWGRVRLARETCARFEYPTIASPECAATPDGYCELAELRDYETIDSACLEVGDRRANHLFYRGSVRVAFPVGVANGTATLAPGVELPSSPMRIRRDGRGHVFVSTFHLDPGEPTPLPEPHGSAFDGETHLRDGLRALGLTGEEQDSFLRAWEPVLLGFEDSPGDYGQTGWPPPELSRTDDAIVYFLPEAVVNHAIPLELAPAPRELRRAILVRVDLTPSTGTVDPSLPVPPAVARLVSTEHEGPMSPAAVHGAHRHRIRDLQTCLWHARPAGFAGGDYTVRYVIDGRGNLEQPPAVGAASTEAGELEPEMERCLGHAVRRTGHEALGASSRFVELFRLGAAPPADLE